MSETEELRARIEELERKVEILFSHTGAVDREKLAADAPPVSSEVESLLLAGKTTKAAKLYQKETGTGMVETMAAFERIVGRG